MVIKLLRSGSPGNLISYLLGGGHDMVDDRAKIITGNFMDLEGSKEELATEFSAYASGSKLKHPCFHCIVSLPPGESLVDNQVHELVQDIEKALKMEDYPYLAVQHIEKEHNHYHIAIGRHSPLHNNVLHDPYSFRVLTKLAREKERQWGLKQLPDPFKKEGFVRSDKRKAAIRLKVTQSLSKAGSYEEFVWKLKLQGISVFKQRGISYSDGVIRVKGSDPGINYSLGQVQFILNAKHEAPGQSSHPILNIGIGNSTTSSLEENKAESGANNTDDLWDLFSGSTDNFNEIPSAASPRPSDEEDEEYWKKKRKKRRLF